MSLVELPKIPNFDIDKILGTDNGEFDRIIREANDVLKK